MEDVFLCPKCGADLSLNERVYRCEKGHCYDLSRSGYVNLLPPGKAVRGDDKKMVQARAAFLSSGHYEPLMEAISDMVSSLLPEGGEVLDCGCGEGCYDAFLLSRCEFDLIGVDISKEAVEKAAKRVKNARFAVASVFHLPLKSEAFDLILNLFAPMVGDEYARVLKAGGYVLKVTPLPEHLQEMKAVLYDEVRPTEPEPENWAGFVADQRRKVVFSMHLGMEGLLSLFEMTPYCYTTPKSGVERLKSLETLDVTAAFRLVLYQKVGENG